MIKEIISASSASSGDMFDTNFNLVDCMDNKTLMSFSWVKSSASMIMSFCLSSFTRHALDCDLKIKTSLYIALKY